MATRYNITLPNGNRFTLLYNQEQEKVELIKELILKPWTGYCLKNWLNDGHGQSRSPEIKVKRLLDRCASLLLRDIPVKERDTLSDYKEAVVKIREIPFSECPEPIQSMMESGSLQSINMSGDQQRQMREFLDGMDELPPKKESEPRKRMPTKFERLQAFEKRFPGCRRTSARVDVDNCFTYHGERYMLDRSLEQYAPHKTRYGDLYDMDQVLVIECADGVLHFADQDGYGIDDEMITSIGR